MSRNLPSLRAIATDPASARELPLDAIDALLGEVAAETTIIGAAKKALTGELDRRYADAVAAAFNFQGKDFGTVRVTDGAYEVIVDRGKKVEWDAERLAEIGDAMVAAGDKPQEYIDVSYGVSERKYAAWPEHIRSVFEPARTVKPGTVSIKLERKAAA